MRYVLEDAKGNVGTITAGDDHTASRYLEIRSSELASEFTKLIKKNTVDVWKMNFTNEDEYPAVFPTLFPNFVNGTLIFTVPSSQTSCTVTGAVSSDVSWKYASGSTIQIAEVK
jgi:hypothetical protein